jgi:hypothetical protein
MKKSALINSAFKIFTMFIMVLLISSCSKDDDNNSNTGNPVPCTKPAAPAVTDTLNVSQGGSIQLTAGTVTGASSYNWSGPNNYSSTSQNPTITNATQANQGNYTVTVTVDGCTSDPATTTVNVSFAAPCTPFTNQTNMTGLPAIAYSPLPGQFGIGTSGNYEIVCNGSNGDVRVQFAISSKPAPGVYRITSLGPLAQPDEAKLSVTAQSAYWTVSGSNKDLYVTDDNGKLVVEFCNLSFSNSTWGTTSNGCFGNITEP